MRENVAEFADNEEEITTNILCRTIRIGSYKFDSKDEVNFFHKDFRFLYLKNLHFQVTITTKGIKIVAPSLRSCKDVTLNIQHSEIVKVVVHFSKQLHIIFLYTKPSCARYIVEQLQMSPASDKCESNVEFLNKIEKYVCFL